MPDTIRRGGGLARPWLGGFVFAAGVNVPTVHSLPARAEQPPPKLMLHELVEGATRSIDRHEIAALVRGFRVSGFWTALFASVFISVLSIVIGGFFVGGTPDTQIQMPSSGQWL